MLSLLLESALRSLVLAAAVWMLLKILRVRNTQTQALAWVVVLAASLAMPLLMRWRTVTIKVPAPYQVANPEWTAPAVRTLSSVPVQPQKGTSAGAFEWWTLLEYVYLAAATLLLLRMAIGLVFTVRLRRQAVSVSEEWTAGCDVRSSANIGAPVTFGSTILIPAEWPEWDATKRNAVLLHEKSHVHRGDFYLQVVAGFHCVAFWFSPLSWWLHKRIAELTEAASDDAAIRVLQDRQSYAEILLEFASLEFARKQPVSSGVAMARPRTVSRRVDRILAETALPPHVSWGWKLLLLVSMAPLIGLVAGCVIRAQTPAPPTFKNPPQASHPAQASHPPQTSHQTWHFRDGDSEPYAILTGDAISMSGSSSDMRRARLLRDRIQGDYIWFERDLKFYFITDPATVHRARELFQPQEELGRKQGELGELQGKLGEEQGRLGEQQGQIRVPVGDFTRTMDQLRDQIEILRREAQKSAGRDVPQDALSDLQSKIGDLQSRLGDLQAQAGDKQAKLGELQAKLGEQQAKLGEKQAELGEQQAHLAEEASRLMRILIDEALRQGLARPVE